MKKCIIIYNLCEYHAHISPSNRCDLMVCQYIYIIIYSPTTHHSRMYDCKPRTSCERLLSLVLYKCTYLVRLHMRIDRQECKTACAGVQVRPAWDWVAAIKTTSPGLGRSLGRVAGLLQNIRGFMSIKPR